MMLQLQAMKRRRDEDQLLQLQAMKRRTSASICSGLQSNAWSSLQFRFAFHTRVCALPL